MACRLHGDINVKYVSDSGSGFKSALNAVIKSCYTCTSTILGFWVRKLPTCKINRGQMVIFLISLIQTLRICSQEAFNVIRIEKWWNSSGSFHYCINRTGYIWWIDLTMLLSGLEFKRLNASKFLYKNLYKKININIFQHFRVVYLVMPFFQF